MKTSYSFLAFRAPLAAVAVSLGFFDLSAQAAPSGASAAASNVVGPSSATAALPAAAPDEDIFDIRPPIHIPEEIFWAGWGFGALVAAGLAYGGWRLLRKKSRAKLPYEIALGKLLAARELLTPDQGRLFSDLVSEVVRSFVEQTYPVRAAHRTTQEFLSDLVAQVDGPLAEHRDRLGEFLGHCDLAKFAMWELSIPQMEAMLQSARDFILAIGAPIKTRHPKTAALGPQPTFSRA